MFNAWLPAPVFCSLWLAAVSCWAGQLHSAWDSCLWFHLWGQMTGLALHPTANVWAEDQNNEIKADGVVEVHIYDIACSKNIAMSFLFLFFYQRTQSCLLGSSTMYGKYHWCSCGDMKRRQAITNCIMDRKLAKMTRNLYADLNHFEIKNMAGCYRALPFQTRSDLLWCHRCNNWDGANASLVPDIGKKHEF